MTISVIILARQGGMPLVSALSQLMPALVDGLVHEAIILGDPEQSNINEIAEESGARFAPLAGSIQPTKVWCQATPRRHWVLCLEEDQKLRDDWQKKVEDIVVDAKGNMSQPHRMIEISFFQKMVWLISRKNKLSGCLCHKSLL